MYALFCTTTYYPNGGWGDFRATYDTLHEAKIAGTNWILNENTSLVEKYEYGDFHIVYLPELTIVYDTRDDEELP